MPFTTSVTYNSIEIFLGIFIVFVSYSIWYFSYWKRKGVVCTGIEFKKNTIDVLMGKRSITNISTELYTVCKAKGYKHLGVYALLKPMFLAVDIELTKVIFNDFKHFCSRGYYVNEKTDTLSMNLFGQEGELWHNARSILSPKFTVTKIKSMLNSILAVSDIYRDVLMQEGSTKGLPVDIHSTTDKYMMDVIGLFAFGIEPQAIKTPQKSMLYQYTKWSAGSFEGKMRMFCQHMLPHSFLSLLNFTLFPQTQQDAFTNIVEQILKIRDNFTTRRNDCIDALFQLRKDSMDDEKKEGVLTEDVELFKQIVAHCYIIFVAGYETTSSTISFMIYELCMNPEMQEKLRNDIIIVLEKHSNKLTYDAIIEIPYLEQVLCETLRKYPQAPMIQRRCAENFKVPNSNMTIDKGTLVIVPVEGIHYDPEYYPDPEKFDPERFSKANKNDRPAGTYLPYGDGPKYCIGKRFASSVIKLTIANLLRAFKFSLNSKTKIPIKVIQRGLTASTEEPIWVDVHKINQQKK